MKTLKQLDLEFARDAGITLQEYKSLSLSEQHNLRITILEKRAKQRK